MNKRVEEKELFLSALRGDVGAQRKCTEKGKQCGGRCIPKSWSCRIKGEGATAPTRGNAIQLTGQQKAKLQGIRARRRRNNTLKALAGVAGVAGAAAGAAYLAGKNPQAIRRLANRVSTVSPIAGALSNIPGPAGRLASVINMGVGAFQAGANMGAGVAQNRRGGLRINELRGLMANTQASSQRMQTRISALQGKRSTYESARSSLMSKMNNGSTTAQRRSLRSLDTAIRKINGDLQQRQTERSVMTRRIASMTKATKKMEGLLTSKYNTAAKVMQTVEERNSDFRRGRRQTSSLKPQTRRGPKADKRSWQERFGLDEAEDRTGKKCGKSAISNAKKCTKGSGTARRIAKAAANAALVGGGVAALLQARKLSLGKPNAAQGATGPWVSSAARYMTANEVEGLRKMRERGQGKYGTLPRRRTGDEIEYHGENFSGYNKPKQTPNHPSKSHVVLAKENGEVKIIRFGQQGVSGSPAREGESEADKARREAFKARHAKNIAKGKMSAAYWANQEKW